MIDFYTVTNEGKTIFAAFHQSIAEPTDRCVTIAVGDSATTIQPEDARELAAMLLRASDALEGRTQ